MSEKGSEKMKEFLKKFFDIKFLKFILVGILNTIVGMGLQFVFFNVFGWDKFGWGVVLASFLGNFIGSVLSYFLNKYFTFKNTEKGWKPVFRFALNIVVCYLIAYVAVSPLVSFICTSNNISMFGMSVPKFAGNAALAVGACTFVACNYVGQRFFAFQEKN
jgi:putative flippase GtrA